MNKIKIKIRWPDGHQSIAFSGDDWLEAANDADIVIPTGCLTGKCGACEIEVNGEIVRACINDIPNNGGEELEVDFVKDPYW